MTEAQIEAGLRAGGFVPTGDLVTSLFLAQRLGKPLLLEGPPGVGKTEVAKQWARLAEDTLVETRDLAGLARGVGELVRRLPR